VANRTVIDGELEHAVEDEAPAPGATTVEPEHELVEVGLQVGIAHRPLVSAEQPPLGQRGDPGALPATARRARPVGPGWRRRQLEPGASTKSPAATALSASSAS